MRFVGDIALDAEVRAIASGAITDGAPVVVNLDGTVQFAGQSTFSLTVGSSATFENATANYNDITFDSNSNRVVISYLDGGNSNYGTAIVGEVNASNNTISFGTPVVFESAATSFTSIDFDSTNNKVLIAYEDDANSDYGTAIVGTVDPSDNSISFGSAAVFESAAVSYITTRFDPDNSKFLIVYKDEGNSNYGTAIVATISGTSVSFGSPTVYYSGSSDYNSCVYDTNANKFLVTYRNSGVNGSGIVGTISGTSVSFGSATAFQSGGTIYVNGTTQRYGMTFDSTANKILIAYQAFVSSNTGYVVVGTISGTSVSFGTAVAVGSAEDSNNNIIGYDPNTNKSLLMSSDYSETPKHTNIREVTVSGTTPTIGSKVSFSTERETTHNSIVFDTTAKKLVIATTFIPNSNYGTAFVIQTSGTVNNITSENFIGFANAAYADGQKATVKTTGSIARNIPQIASASSTVGTEVVYGSAGSNLYIDATFDSSNNRVVIVYRDGPNSNYGTAVVGNVSGTSISFGTPVTYNTSGSTDPNAIGFDSNSNKVVIAYRDGGDSDKGKAIVGTVDPSDNSITFGSEVEFNGGNTGYPNVVFDSSNNKIVIVYTDYGNSSYGTAIVGTVSGTSISFGSEVVFESAASYYTAATFDSSNNKIVVAYNDDGNSNHGTAIVGTVSGTSISFGTPAVFNTASTTSGFGPGPLGIAFDSTNNKVVIAYADGGDSSHGYAIVGTVSGTDISFGSETEFENAVIYGLSAVFDTSSNKIVISYTDETNSYYGTFTLGTVSSTSISFETAAVFASATTQYIASTFDTNSNRVVTAYADTQGPTANNGTAIVIRPAGQGEDLTIGQQYFVQTDGTLGTSADDPSVIAGTAIGTSDIIVKG